MEARWNGRKDVAATDMADSERDEAKCSIHGGLFWSLQTPRLNQPFAYQLRPLRICFDELPDMSPEVLNEVRILQRLQNSVCQRLRILRTSLRLIITRWMF